MISGKSSHSRLLLILAGICIALYILPYILLRGSSHILIHDSLDLAQAGYKVLIESGQLFAPNDAIIAPLMGGMPRSTFPSEFSLTVLLYALFDPLSAYIAQRVLQVIIGFVGSYALLRTHLVPGEKFAFVQIGVALAYAFLPFWPFGALSVAGLPLLLFAFLNLRQGDRRATNWLIILFFPFTASLVFSGVFFLALVSCILLYDLIRQRHINWTMIWGLILLGATFIFTHYRLFMSFLGDAAYISHRYEMESSRSLGEAIRDMASVFVEGQYHAHSLHGLIILPTLLVALVLMSRYRLVNLRPLLILIFIIATAIFYGFWRWDGLDLLMDPITARLPLNLGRFHYLHPMLWSILFAFSLSMLISRFQQGRMIVSILIVLQLVYTVAHHELLANRHTPTYDAFFAEAQFAAVRDTIDEPQNSYRVISVGMHPAIAQYNGFYTLDGYMVDYPLSYKHQFRQIIAQELAKAPDLQRYFDQWGSRAYAFSAELGTRFIIEKGSGIVLGDLDIDLDAFTALGGRYILSAVAINTETNPEYELLQIFRDEQSAWDLYLYGIR